MTDLNGASAPNANLRLQFGADEPQRGNCPTGCTCWRCADWDNGEEDYSARLGHRCITAAQHGALFAGPSAGMGLLLVLQDAPHAIAAAGAMLLTQQCVLRLAAADWHDAAEWGANVLGGAIAFALVASAAPDRFLLLASIAALTAASAFWPHAFHAWRGSLVTDFEFERDGHAFPRASSPDPF